MGEGSDWGGEKYIMTAGRPSIYDPEVHPAKAYTLAKKGKTNTEIAKGLGINRDTVTDWMNKYPEFSAAIKSGKETPNDKVELSLYKRAMGYDYIETKTYTNEDGQIYKTETTTKKVIPDVGAQCMWLKNRRPKEWRDKQEIEHSGTLSWVDLVKLTDGETPNP